MLLAVLGVPGAAAPVSSLEVLLRGEGDFRPTGELDRKMLASWSRRGVVPAARCSDEVFLRRVHLDLIGTLPRSGEVRRFLRDRSPGKRDRLVDRLLAREEFADYWTLKWCDLLRVKAEFPVNLWPNAVQAYHRWIRWALHHGMPYDRFAGQLLTSSGSNFRVAPVNFFRAVQGQEPAALAAAVALTFMGERVERWPADRRADLEVFFSRVAFKGTAEWKEEIVYLDPEPVPQREARLPDGTRVTLDPERDPRMVFARWLTRPENPWFARNLANRAWSWFLGRGFYHPADDFRSHRPIQHPEALAHLERVLVDSGWDLRRLFREILTSATYQQASLGQAAGTAPEEFAAYPVRRLDAEVLRDALRAVYGGKEKYTSMIPEPFTFVPGEHRSIELADGSITSHFLEMFGRPPRDTGLESERSHEPSRSQRLHLLNSREVILGIRRSHGLKALLRKHGREPEAALEALYLRILSRLPRPEEVARVRRELSGREPREVAEDVVWALLNSKEFLYRH